MGQLADAALAVVVLADHISADGKLYALGLGLNITVVGVNGLTPPMSVACIVDVPHTFVGQDVAVLLELRDTTAGGAVKVIGPAGSSEPLRFQQLARVEPLNVPGFYLSRDMPSRLQIVVAFAGGLPLVAGHFYEWRLELDGQHHRSWVARFHVAGPPPAVLFGGPTGDPDIVAS